MTNINLLVDEHWTTWRVMWCVITDSSWEVFGSYYWRVVTNFYVEVLSDSVGMSGVLDWSLREEKNSVIELRVEMVRISVDW